MCYIRDRDKGDPCKRSPRGNCKTVSRKQALETGADIRVERLHSVNGDGYRTPRMARNARFVRPAGIRSGRRDWLAAGAVPIEPVSSLHFGQMQGDFRKMQGGARRNLAKSHQVSIAWNGVSLLKRAGKSRENHLLPSRVAFRVAPRHWGLSARTRIGFEPPASPFFGMSVGTLGDSNGTPNWVR